MTDADLKALLQARIHRRDPHARERGDYDLNPKWLASVSDERTLKPAAVLIPIIERASGLRVLFTRRADHLARHAGQVSFPGGRLHENDDDEVAAALRETEEEVGLSRTFVTVLGELDRYETGTGFAIHPFVGLVRDGFELTIDKSEVAEAFEVPLAFLMDPQNHEPRTATWQGRERRFYGMTYDGHYIWGATAGILINLHERLYG